MAPPLASAEIKTGRGRKRANFASPQGCRSGDLLRTRTTHVGLRGRADRRAAGWTRRLRLAGWRGAADDGAARRGQAAPRKSVVEPVRHAGFALEAREVTRQGRSRQE